MCLSTGNRYLDIGLSVAVGAVTGGLMAPAMVVGSTVPVAATMAGGIGAFLSGGSLVAASVGASVLGGAAMGLATGVLGAALMPQQQSYNQQLTGMPYTPQPYNTQHTKVTGSGGRQAAAVLASEIKQAKSLRQRQAEVADYGLGMDVAGTGLQIA
jgi:hypothetical protein